MHAWLNIGLGSYGALAADRSIALKSNAPTVVPADAVGLVFVVFCAVLLIVLCPFFTIYETEIAPARPSLVSSVSPRESFSFVRV